LHADSVVANAIAEVAHANGQPADASDAVPADDAYDVPAVPDERVASGLVWPPVDGRLVLHELTQMQVPLTRCADGAWSGEIQGRWLLYSEADEVFQDLEQGRAVLVQAARAQAVAARDRGPACCIVLAADGYGQYRLWRIERIAAN
jgi:hypothetical protein